MHHTLADWVRLLVLLILLIMALFTIPMHGPENTTTFIGKQSVSEHLIPVAGGRITRHSQASF